MSEFHSTTIVAVQKNGVTSLAGDGQVTMGQTTIMKATAKKVRKIYNDKVLVGFAGSVSDAFILFEQFESMLEKSSGKLLKSAVELVKQWRNSTIPTKLEAMLIVADNNEMLLVSGTGEIIQPEDGILAIGSGGNYAYAAAKALNENTGLEAPQIAEKALEIAADICVFTNRNIIVETLGGKSFE